MKKTTIISVLKYIPVLTLVTTLFISCDDLVNEKQISEIPISDFYRNNKDAESGVVGIYDAMQTAYNENYFRWGEIRSDSYTRGSGSASTNDLDLVDNNVTSGNPAVTRWNILYVMINRANFAIQKIPQIPAFDTNLLGEALALRAYAYFTMVKVWGGVPLFTEPTLAATPGIFKPRTDASVIMKDLIIPDMIKAENLIGIPSREFRWSKASIYAFQAEVYMWQKDYPNAKIALDKLVALKTHSLATTAQAWQDQFYNNPADAQRLITTTTGTTEIGRGKIQTGSELIFSLFFDQSNPSTNIGVSNGNRSGIQRNFMAGLPPFYISASLEAKWKERFPTDSIAFVTKYPGAGNVLTKPDSKVDPVTGKLISFTRKVYGDYRFYLSREKMFDFASLVPGNARVIKWQQQNIPVSVDDSNIPIYRYSGQLLLLAEVENRLNNITGSLALINLLRTARLLPKVTLAEFGATIDAREDYILDERQFELLGEGQRAFDLIRTGRFVETMNKEYALRGTPLIDKNRILLPIYFEHFQENPAIKGQQNPGYDTN